MTIRLPSDRCAGAGFPPRISPKLSVDRCQLDFNKYPMSHRCNSSDRTFAASAKSAIGGTGALRDFAAVRFSKSNDRFVRFATSAESTSGGRLNFAALPKRAGADLTADVYAIEAGKPMLADGRALKPVLRGFQKFHPTIDPTQSRKLSTAERVFRSGSATR